MRSLLALTLSLTPLFAHAAGIGRVVEASGDVQIMQADAPVPLKAGSLLETRQPLTVGSGSMAVLQMDDDEVISLGADARFEVLDYQFDPKSQTGNSARYRLDGGTARLISGVIARQQPGSVLLETPYGLVSTVGTDYGVRVCAAGAGCGAPGVYVTVNSGQVKVSSPRGSQTANAGQIVFSASIDAAPVLVASLPNGLGLAPDPEPFLLAAGVGVGPLRIEITSSVCDPLATPSTPTCSAGR